MNIAEILKYCPEGTRLYSPIFGEVDFIQVLPLTNMIRVRPIKSPGVRQEFYEDGTFYEGGECVLFPSNSQRDWYRFRLPFKAGDIVMTKDGETPFIFKGYAGNIYAHCYCGVDIYNTFKIEYPVDTYWTNEFIIPASKEAKKKLFDKMAEAGYIWYIDTLELEKVKPKFKEGDVVIDTDGNLFIFNGIIKDNKIQVPCVFINGEFVNCGVSMSPSPISSLKLASEEDRNKVYSTLIKKGYKYDKGRHILIKQEFKPFDKVLVKNEVHEVWTVNIFSHYFEGDNEYPYACLDGHYCYCIPYEGNEYILGTTINQV